MITCSIMISEFPYYYYCKLRLSFHGEWDVCQNVFFWNKKHKKLQTYARPFMQQCSMQKAQYRGTPSKPEYQGIDKLVKKRGFTQRATASYVQPIS